MAKVPFDCFAFICLVIRFVRNRKGRERKVSYLVHSGTDLRYRKKLPVRKFVVVGNNIRQG